MSGVDTNRGSVELSVVTAERALAVPRLQHGGTPRRIAAPLDRVVRIRYQVGSVKNGLRVESNRGEDVGCDGGREVAFDQRSGSCLDQVRVAAQRRLERRVESADNMVLRQRRD